MNPLPWEFLPWTPGGGFRYEGEYLISYERRSHGFHNDVKHFPLRRFLAFH